MQKSERLIQHRESAENLFLQGSCNNQTNHPDSAKEAHLEVMCGVCRALDVQWLRKSLTASRRASEDESRSEVSDSNTGRAPNTPL
ncbi:MAG: hypothetical protein PHO64_11455 [Thiomonas sp.]|nr:hypothetical protein [Thiomonas sp.]